jgi:hypothetical protein
MQAAAGPPLHCLLVAMGKLTIYVPRTASTRTMQCDVLGGNERQQLYASPAQLTEPANRHLST